MCSSKAMSLADSLEKELSRIGLSLNSTPNSLFNKLNNDLETARRKLHKFVDDYFDSLKNELIRKLKGESGDQGSINTLVQEIKQMVIELRLHEKGLYGKNKSFRQSNFKLH